MVRVTAENSAGSGFTFAVEGTTAFVITNQHIVQIALQNTDVQVRDTQTYKATVLGLDDELDIAVVSICCSSDFHAIPWETEATPAPDTDVVAVGYPRSSSSRVTSTLGKVTQGPQNIRDDQRVIWHTAPLNPGNSGGPLLSMKGTVWGVNAGTSDGVFAAIAYRSISELIEEWKGQLVVAPNPTPSPDEDSSNVVLWVIIGTPARGSRSLVWVDTEFDADRYALDVFVDSQEFCNPARIYADEGRYELGCDGLGKAHTAVQKVSVQSRTGDMRCRKFVRMSSNVETAFGCVWR